uniref:(California timema) hypothetical protein n=1 Tax=Timema californicum TaxID=61474 RepID=A0A7R9J0X0_TIMCA|nr:unnamed protein product [Timema californicum]
MFGRTLKSKLAKDNGRSTEFIRRKDYPDKSWCYECMEPGHLSYKCPLNALGEREPPPKKDKARKKKMKEKLIKAQFQKDEEDSDSDFDNGLAPQRMAELRDAEEDVEPDLETLSAAIRLQRPPPCSIPPNNNKNMLESGGNCHSLPEENRRF